MAFDFVSRNFAGFFGLAIGHSSYLDLILIAHVTFLCACARAWTEMSAAHGYFKQFEGSTS